MFGRHAIGMVWDYAEAAPDQLSGDLWENWIKKLAEFVESNAQIFTKTGQVMLGDAAHQALPDASAECGSLTRPTMTRFHMHT